MPEQILIVDDEQDMRLLLRLQLGQEGYLVSEASDGHEALRRLRELAPAVVITDVRMPGLSGLELLREVKRTLPATEVITITGYAELQMAVECLRAGGFDLLQKPFDVQVMLSCVARALDRYRLNVSADLVRASQSLFATNDLDRLPQAIVDASRACLVADAAVLAMQDYQGELHLARAGGLASEEQGALLCELGARVVAGLATDGTPALLGPGVEDPRFEQGVELAPGESAILFPLTAGERVLGVLGLLRREGRSPFGKVDVDRAALLACHVVLALENARLACQVAAAERLATLGQVAAGIGHEINNPAAYILSNLNFAREQLAAWRQGARAELEEVEEALAEASEGAHRISDIVRDMRALARTEQGAGGWFELGEALRSALRIARVELQQRAELVTEFAEGLEVRGSPGPISQVFVNLLINAAQALEGWSGARKEIHLVARREEGQVVVDVRDTGPGIPPENLSRLFQPFFTTKGATGTGLGLSISRNIIQRHGGNISVRSEPGAGTVFTVSLPARESREESVPD